jgi:hypothetical protein
MQITLRRANQIQGQGTQVIAPAVEDDGSFDVKQCETKVHHILQQQSFSHIPESAQKKRKQSSSKLSERLQLGRTLGLLGVVSG